MTVSLYQGDCLGVLKQIPDNSVDSLVTDPPAGISFMGKDFDSDRGGRDAWVDWLAPIMKEASRTLKPGSHALVWALPRTSHWTMTAIENAGFEIRDVITHLFSQGMPKSMDISKAIDKALKVDGTYGEIKSKDHEAWIKRGQVISEGSNEGWDRPWMDDPEAIEKNARKYISGSEEAAKWAGWGTALKPGAEYWILARKPLAEKTLTSNIIRHGAGAINIEECRIPTTDNLNGGAYSGGKRNAVTGDSRTAVGAGMYGEDGRLNPEDFKQPTGRWPSNVILSHGDACTEDVCESDCPVGMVDKQSEGVSRFYYCPKAPKKDKGTSNSHPTVKNTVLMEYLIRLITPVGGVVLDPFMGSGSTGVAAVRGGWGFVGIELSDEYFQIAQRRIEGT